MFWLRFDKSVGSVWEDGNQVREASAGLIDFHSSWFKTVYGQIWYNVIIARNWTDAIPHDDYIHAWEGLTVQDGISTYHRGPEVPIRSRAIDKFFGWSYLHVFIIYRVKSGNVEMNSDPIGVKQDQ